jgi:hypothetical protein
VPAFSTGRQADWLGSMVDGMEICGDIVSPVIEEKAKT